MHSVGDYLYFVMQFTVYVCAITVFWEFRFTSLSPRFVLFCCLIILTVRAAVRSVLLLVIDMLCNTTIAVYVLNFCGLYENISAAWIHSH